MFDFDTFLSDVTSVQTNITGAPSTEKSVNGDDSGVDYGKPMYTNILRSRTFYFINKMVF